MDLPPEELAQHIREMLKAQQNKCKLTGIRMLLDDEQGDDVLKYSLDRIVSEGHYQRGNLQLVCQFVNLWKRNPGMRSSYVC